MCGIFAYSGYKNASPIIINGLKRLEYRGYDSWGLGLKTLKPDDTHDLFIHKKVGGVADISEIPIMPESNLGLGHTRWATHGGVTETNAHPHLSTDGKFFLVQNGMVQNYQNLKTYLIDKGYPFYSQTDTEVIVRLIEDILTEEKDFHEAVKKAFLRLEGRNTIVVVELQKDLIIGVKNGSPLVVGINAGELYLASDSLSLSEYTREMITLSDYEMVVYQKGWARYFNVFKSLELTPKVEKINFSNTSIDKGVHDSFYLKEVLEQPETILNAISYTREDLEDLVKSIKNARRVYTVGCGTAYYAASEGAYFLRALAGVDAYALEAYELFSYKNVFTSEDILIAVSQSGETADTLEAVTIAKECGVKIASIVNMLGSTLTKESDFPFYTRSGPEISVVSTKAYTAQLSWFLLLAHTISDKYDLGVEEIKKASISLSKVLNDSFMKNIENLAQKLNAYEGLYILGRGQNHIVAKEAALKVKEISYIHAEGFSAGELKHGVIALIQQGTPVITFASNDECLGEALSAVAQVKARGAYTIGVATESNDLFDFEIVVPDCGVAQPIVNIVPMQLLGYHLAKLRGLSPDKPRNLAKSVTVK